MIPAKKVQARANTDSCSTMLVKTINRTGKIRSNILAFFEFIQDGD